MEKGEILDTSVAIGRKEGTNTVLTVLEYPHALKKLFTVLLPDSQDYARAIEIASHCCSKELLLEQGYAYCSNGHKQESCLAYQGQGFQADSESIFLSFC